MANLTESINWENGIYQLETTDDALAGSSGVMNQQAKQLANRTQYLNKAIEDEAELRYQNDANITQSIINFNNSLGDAAFKDTGTTAGTVAAGNDARFTDARERKMVDGTVMHTKEIEIGDWNMDSVETKSIPHNVTASKIRIISVLIRNDSDTDGSPIRLPIGYANSTGNCGGSSRILGSNIILNRSFGGVFDDTDFDSTGFNRGWIIIEYKD